jgi:UDP-2-acetamido-3-amino-2,3-dideoxy-glucuronate N-acetyltransferase
MNNASYTHPSANIYESAEIGEGTKIGAFVEIGKNVKIGARCSIQSGVYIPENVVICDDVFIGPCVVFTNDKYPPSHGAWRATRPTEVADGVSIGANATILPSIHIGPYARVGAGAVVTKDVLKETTVVGNPARPIR